MWAITHCVQSVPSVRPVIIRAWRNTAKKNAEKFQPIVLMTQFPMKSKCITKGNKNNKSNRATVDGQIDSITERWPVLLFFFPSTPASFWEVTRTAGALPSYLFIYFFFFNFFFAASGCIIRRLWWYRTSSLIFTNYYYYFFHGQFFTNFLKFSFLGHAFSKINWLTRAPGTYWTIFSKKLMGRVTLSRRFYLPGRRWAAEWECPHYVTRLGVLQMDG